MKKNPERTSRSKLPARFRDFSMVDSDSSENEDLEETIKDNTEAVTMADEQQKNLEAQLVNMKLQMEEMRANLQAEQKESKRLADLLSQQQSDAAQQNTDILTSKQQGQSIPATIPPSQSNVHQDQVSHENTTNHASFHDNTRVFNRISNRNAENGKIEALPKFSGVPEDFPAFKVSYQESNAMMKYSNWENHLRLSNNLVGEAKEAVQALMIHPKNVDAVMLELEEQFGQPEQLLRSQLSKFRKMTPIPEHRLEKLIPFATKVRNLAAFLETMDSVPHLANPNLLDELLNIVPPSKREGWGMYALDIKPYRTVRDFSNWLTKLSRVISITTNYSYSASTPSVVRNTGTKPKLLHASTTNCPSQSNDACTFCNGKHKIAECEDFKKLSITERWDAVKSKHLCFSCLRTGHPSYNCRSKRKCNINGCTMPHHILLHEDKPNDEKEAKKPSSFHMNSAAASCHSIEDTDVLFKIVPVRLYGPSKSVDTFAMFDEGSSVTLVDESIIKTLEIKGKEEQLTLQWFGNHTSSEPSQLVEMEVSAVDCDTPKYKLNEVRTVKHIDLPLQTLNIASLQRSHRSIKKLPICSYENAQPLLLIGLNNSFLGAPIQTSFGSSWNGPIAMKTKLGWMVYGQTTVNSSRAFRQYHISKAADENMEKAMYDYFTSENFGVKPCKDVESDSDKHAKHLLESTTIRLEDVNKYQTGLLWKDPNVVLPNSYSMAKNRLLSIEKKMIASPDFKKMYVEKINGYFSKGYARKLTSTEAAETTDRTWYLPHFTTSNPNKPGKYRLVFDAAAKVRGTSLNDFLLKGPDSYNKLIDVLYNFRLNEVGVCADIREMFSQVLIQPSDKHSQRFLWRDNGDPTRPIEECIMEVMTFGATCSPASAHHVKNTNALRFIETHPEAVSSIVDHHYVDDFVDSFPNVEHAKRVSSDVKMIHQEAGFELRGFISNSAEVADFLNDSPTEESKRVLDLESTGSEKILGMIWDTSDDSFKFLLKFSRVPKDVINGDRRPTKREILSVTMSVFDPFGLLCNITIHLKVMVQQLWRLRIDWDEEIPDTLNAQWNAWRSELEKVKMFRIPRYCFEGLSSPIEIQIHTFVDSSEEAFAAVTYLRCTDGNNVAVKFMCAKTRCSPIKKLMSIPRLELQSAVLGCRLSTSVIETCKLTVNKRFFWSDSATVIKWIKSDHRRYKPFVGHRISEILETTEPNEWNWLSTKINVADESTRAKYPINYKPDGPWLNGPQFLLEDPSEWPCSVPNEPPSAELEELRNKCVHQISTKNHFIDFNRFSTFCRLRRVLGWIRRFVNNKFHIDLKRRGELTVAELNKADVLLCKMVQQDAFGEELAALKQGKRIKKCSHIYKLSPVLAKDGFLRVNSRIRRATVIPDSAKSPIILPKNHIVTNLIVDYYHNKNHHHNKQTIINEIRQQYWIPSIKSTVDKAKSRCQECKNRSAIPAPPLMGELPYDRLAAYVRPFSYCGVDYFGPLEVTIGRRREKRWAALFTCMTVRAVHIELAADLSTDSCLVCIRNFVNRRGVPIRMRSDNGTNFVGASKELKDAIDAIDNNTIQAAMSTINVEWIFNSPDNPEAGGAWERLIQSVKKVLSYTLHEEAPRVETLQSLLIEAESIVNNRPLTDVSLCHEDADPITPNHFILGAANYTQTPGEDDKKIWCLRKQWRISQQLKNRFWKKWVDDYLPGLICRSKWYMEVNPIKIGDVAMIVDSTTSKHKWTKGRIVEVFPGTDGQVRRVKIKTATGVFIRPACKVAVMDVQEAGKRPTED